MKKAPIKLSGYKDITLIAKSGIKYNQDLQLSGEFYIPPGYEKARFFARKEKDIKIEIFEGIFEL